LTRASKILAIRDLTHASKILAISYFTRASEILAINYFTQASKILTISDDWLSVKEESIIDHGGNSHLEGACPAVYGSDFTVRRRLHIALLTI